MITKHYIAQWINKVEKTGIKHIGREIHEENTKIRHFYFENKITEYIIANGYCTFENVWKQNKIKRTTCFMVIKNMVNKGIIKRKKIIIENRKQYAYYVGKDTVSELGTEIVC